MKLERLDFPPNGIFPEDTLCLGAPTDLRLGFYQLKRPNETPRHFRLAVGDSNFTTTHSVSADRCIVVLGGLGYLIESDGSGRLLQTKFAQCFGMRVHTESGTTALWDWSDCWIIPPVGEPQYFPDLAHDDLEVTHLTATSMTYTGRIKSPMDTFCKTIEILDPHQFSRAEPANAPNRPDSLSP